VVGSRAKEAFAVHTFVFDRDGDFVIVDYQNSHHRDFRRIKPDSDENCLKLTAVRLASYLK
jgi:hypothetical protein